MHFLLCTKGFHESTNFDTFKCSDEYFSNSSCHFPYHKSIFLQILHDFSLSWNITPLYFFRSNVIYFSQKELMKMQFFKLLGARKNSENLKNFLVLKIHQVLVIFEKKKMVILMILFSIMRHNSMLPFKLKFYILSTKGTYQSTILVKFRLSSRKSKVSSFCKSDTNFRLKKYLKKTYLSWHWRVMQRLKKTWLVVSIMTLRSWWIFIQPLKNPKISL